MACFQIRSSMFLFLGSTIRHEQFTLTREPMSTTLTMVWNFLRSISCKNIGIRLSLTMDCQCTYLVLNNESCEKLVRRRKSLLSDAFDIWVKCTYIQSLKSPGMPIWSDKWPQMHPVMARRCLALPWWLSHSVIQKCSCPSVWLADIGLCNHQIFHATHTTILRQIFHIHFASDASAYMHNSHTCQGPGHSWALPQIKPYCTLSFWSFFELQLHFSKWANWPFWFRSDGCIRKYEPQPW